MWLDDLAVFVILAVLRVGGYGGNGTVAGTHGS